MPKSVIILSLIILMLAGGALVISGEVLADPAACPNNNTWNGSVDSNWSNARNWDCNVVPQRTSAVIPAVNSRGQAIVNFPVVPDSTPLVNLANLEVYKDASFNLNGRTLIVSGKLTNNGTLIDTQIIPEPGVFPPTAYFFAAGAYGGLELKRDMGVYLFDPSPVTVRIKGGQSCDDKVPAVKRCFDIEPTIGENVSVDAVFYFSRSELLPRMECSTLQAFRWSGSGWEAAGSYGGSNCVGDLLSVKANNITRFSPFILTPGAALAVSAVSFDAVDYQQDATLILAAALLLGLLSLFLLRGQLATGSGSIRQLPARVRRFWARKRF